jgi:hypothetical protein
VHAADVLQTIHMLLSSPEIAAQTTPLLRFEALCLVNVQMILLLFLVSKELQPYSVLLFSLVIVFFCLPQAC